MVYITGDIHGDMGRFKDNAINKLKKNDTLIVCGDFGFIWKGSHLEQSLLKKLGKQKFNIAFVDGCHENFDLLEGYPIENWYGGKARVISGKLIQMIRGEIYHIEGKEFFAFGGGASDDYDFRIESKTWYKREQGSHSEIRNAAENLEKYHNKVDYIITHEPPQKIKALLNIPVPEQFEMDIFFDKISKECKFKCWFFGKIHMNRRIPPYYYALFDDIIKIG